MVSGDCIEARFIGILVFVLFTTQWNLWLPALLEYCFLALQPVNYRHVQLIKPRKIFANLFAPR